MALPLKVLVVTPVYPHPKPGFFPEIERYAQLLVRGLVSKGLSVEIVTSYWNGGAEEETVDGVPLHRTGDSSRRLSSLGMIFDLHYLTLGRSMLSRWKDKILASDVVHALMPLSTAEEVQKLKPLVSQFYHPALPGGPLDSLHLPFHHRIERSAYQSSDLVLTLSESSKNLLVKYLGTDEPKVRVAYPGVDTSMLTWREYVPPRGAAKLLFVGKLERRKGVDVAIEAIAKATRLGADVKLDIVGEGPEKGSLLSLAERERVADRVSFDTAPFIPSDQLVEHYHSHDIFVFPTRLEGFGYPVAEAMSCGLPVIASDSTSMREVLGDAGIIVKQDDSEALARAVVELVGDPSMARRFSVAGRARVERNFTWGESIERTVRVYEEAIALRRNRGP